MVIFLGESSSGKSTIEKELVEKFGYKKLISYTTREPRANEVNGKDYHFVTNEEFYKLKLQGFFAEVGEYNGWSYGSAVEDCTDDKVFVSTPHGLRQLKKNKDLHIISFYIKTSRRDRLIKILERGDNIDESYRRNLSDVGQFDGIEDEVTYVIDNVGFKKSVEEVTNKILHLLD